MAKKSISQIEPLTEAEKAQIPAVRDKWMAVACNTEPANMEVLEQYVHKAYQQVGKPVPKYVFHATGPVVAACMVIILRDVLDFYLDATPQRWRYQPSEHSAKAKPVNPFLLKALEELKPQFEKFIPEINWAVEWDNLVESVRTMYTQHHSTCTKEFNTALREQYFGNHDAYWLLYHDFFKNVCDYDLQDVDGLEGIANNCGWWASYEKAAIVQDRIKSFNLNDELRLHRDGGPALEWRDGAKVWALNGVEFSAEEAWIIERAPEDFSSEDCLAILQIRNAEVRREALKKIGPTTLFQKVTPTVLDEEPENHYRLLALDIGRDDGELAVALHMRNPSVDHDHVEWVARTCRTVQDAINFRNGLNADQIDDVEGEDYVQQGDVLLFAESKIPFEQRKFKSRPRILT